MYNDNRSTRLRLTCRRKSIRFWSHRRRYSSQRSQKIRFDRNVEPIAERSRNSESLERKELWQRVSGNFTLDRFVNRPEWDRLGCKFQNDVMHLVAEICLSRRDLREALRDR